MYIIFKWCKLSTWLDHVIETKIIYKHFEWVIENWFIVISNERLGLRKRIRHYKRSKTATIFCYILKEIIPSEVWHFIDETLTMISDFFCICQTHNCNLKLRNLFSITHCKPLFTFCKSSLKPANHTPTNPHIKADSF